MTALQRIRTTPFPTPQSERGLVAKLSSWAACLLLAACSTTHYTVNPPLAAGRGASGYSERNLAQDGERGGPSVTLAFSGGGYRAAAMAHAVLEVLRDTRFGTVDASRRLLDHVDAISAVSGGSLTAMDYALHGERHFADFDERVLSTDLETALLRHSLSPVGLWRQTSARWGRGDVLQQLLDERVFAGRTFADLPRRRPMVYVNATELTGGRRFEFTQDRFDALCSDLDGVPLARAVAASMAVPVLLSPITLWDYAASCPVGGQGPHPPGVSRGHLHLVDGGLADNTGLRRVTELEPTAPQMLRSSRSADAGKSPLQVLIVVNAQVAAEPLQQEPPDTPNVLRQMREAVDLLIDRDSARQLMTLADAVERWRRASTTRAAARDIRVIEVGVAAARDRGAAEGIRRIRTGLRIDSDELQRVRAFVRGELAADPAWRQLLHDLDEAVASPATLIAGAEAPGSSR